MELKAKWLLGKNRSCSCVMPGVYRAAAYAKGCVVLFHSPRGCAHVASTMDMGSQYRGIAESQLETMDAVPLLSSNMREKDTIFGGTDRLRDAIGYTMKTYHPEYLVIAASCVAGVIGDDVAAAAEDAEEEYGVPVIAVTEAGFLGGEYGDGYRIAMNQMIDRFFKPQPHRKGTALLLGDQMGPWGQYAQEVGRILHALGYEAAWQFPGYVPFKEWAQIPSAEIGVVLGGMGQTNSILEDAAGKLEKDFGISFMKEPVYPIGWENTRRFIEAIADLTGEKEKGRAFLAEEEQNLSRFVEDLLPVTEGKQAVIAIGRSPMWYDPTDTIHSLKRLHMKVGPVLLFDNLSESDSAWMRKKVQSICAAEVLSMEEGQDGIGKADLLLTTNEILNPGTRQLFIPMVALVGASGERHMLRGIYRALCRYGNKGGIAYV